MARKFFTGIDLVDQRAVNVADPAAGTDAVNLQTMEARFNGRRDKPAVRAASTGSGIYGADIRDQPVYLNPAGDFSGIVTTGFSQQDCVFVEV